MPPTPALRGQWTSPGSPAGFLGSNGWDKRPPLLSCSSGLGGPLPPASPDLPGLPPMPPGPMRLGGTGGPWRAGTHLGAQQTPVPKWAGQLPSLPLPFLPQGPSHLPLLISLASGVPILSGLHFSSSLSPLTSYQFTLGSLPSPWASESPHQQPAGTLVVGRR